ncbi:hypothetical protein ACHMW6_00140 (plasmid) [Pseudoduganella sp. UC29_106]|uniref:hypothetical protein n=1 Tax=Pseudoduganella sp. UC29_106 TaxID=3374553 RepID=UPI003757D4B0
MKATIRAVSNKVLDRYQQLPKVVRYGALPHLVISLPMLIGSLLAAYYVMPVAVLLSAYLLYSQAKQSDEVVFQMSKNEARLAVTFPLCSFVSAWVIVLSAQGNAQMLNGIVGPYCLMLLIACAPAFRWKHERTARRFPLAVTFSITAAIALAASLSYIEF